MKDLDLVAMRSAAERFQAAASDESSPVRDYIETYNAYVEAVGVDNVLALLNRLVNSESAVARIRATHRKSTIYYPGYGYGCDGCMGTTYPCRTIRALDGKDHG